MQQISNKNLTLLLLIAIVVSIAGTIISINRLNQLIFQAPTIPITGMASSGTGMVNVTIAGVTSISATDTIIQFGSCSPATSVGCNATSNISNNNFGCSCSGGFAPDNLTVKNDGNRALNVTVRTSSLAKTFIGGTSPRQAEMWFSVRNSSKYPGCLNATGTPHSSDPTFDSVDTAGMQWNWKNFSLDGADYLACSNLTYGASTNSIYVFAKIFLPANAPAGANRTATLTFTAANW